jgi:predicted nucleic acid-binding protein
LASRIRIYLDTNIFVYAMERPKGMDPLIADLLVDILELKGHGGPPPLATSALFLAEVLVVPYRENRGQLVADYEGLLTGTSDIDIVPITASILRSAARLRSKTSSIKLPDAIHLATATELECTHFLTADRELIRLMRFVEYPVPCIDITVSALLGLVTAAGSHD